MNKREILCKLLNLSFKRAPKGFWPKEAMMLKRLMEKLPDKSFWETVEIPKVDSLTYYHNGSKLLKELEERYKNHFFQPEFTNPQIKLGDKQGEDYNTTNKPRTIKDFLK